ncbi:unnamed protein product [Adineta ricciae]|uniref:BED-type domain-containing protein n=1 Tax=Adineta ricciae TaxID=249248 RepID=A0A816CHN8_ADIRI|nr:unnamed protein product [Adineta ricciae]
MDSSPTASTIELTLPSRSRETDSSKDDKLPGVTRAKIGRQGLERYYNDFKEYTTGDLKGKTSARCALCKEQVWHVKNSTSNYSRHLQRKHPAEFQLWSEDVAKGTKSGDRMQQTTLDISLSPTTHTAKYSLCHPRQIELTRMVFHDFVIGLDLPLSITEKTAFVRAMATVDPKFRVPSRRSIVSSYLPRAYDQISTKLKNVCTSALFVSLTFDAWTDRRMRAFYAVTIHYINGMGQLKAHLLAFNPLSGSHTSENLYIEYERVSTAFTIGNKIVRLITDNASNNLAAFGELVIPGFESYFVKEEDVEDIDDDVDEINLSMSEGNRPDDENVLNESERGEELLRLPCFIHTLQLVVKDGLKESNCSRSALAKVAQIAKLSHTSIPVAEKLQELKFSIPEAVITRWNSQFITITKVLDIPNALLNDLLAEQKKTELILSMKDLSVLREFTSIFTLFAEATTRTQTEQCLSISLVAPSVLAIYFDLENESKLSKHSSSLCHALILSLKQRFGGLLINLEIPVDDSIKRRSTFSLFSDDIFLISAFLDGQFRLRWILQSALSEETKIRLCDRIKLLVIQAAFRLEHSSVITQTVDDPPNELTAAIAGDDPSGVKESSGASVTPKRKSLFSYCETSSAAASKKMRADIIDEINEEMVLFLKDQRYESDLIFARKGHCPHLYRLAMRVLCVPATSAPAERVFSRSGLLMRPHRSRLTKDSLAKLTFVKCNIDLLS